MKTLLMLTSVLTLTFNSISAAEVVEDDGHGDLHRDHLATVSTPSGASVEDDGHGDLHRDPPTQKNASLITSHL